MRYTYCPDCGEKLVLKEIGDEGMIPWCNVCSRPWFDIFPTCVMTLVVNEYEEAVLLKQDYLSTKYRNLVTGFMQPGESAETAAVREVEEEAGIVVDSAEFAGTYWFEAGGILMIGFIAHVKKAPLTLSREVQQADWVPVREAINLVFPKEEGNVTYILLEKYIASLDAAKPDASVEV